VSAVDASTPVAAAVAAAPRFRRSRLLTDPLLAGLWLAFAVANLKAWHTTHRPVGLGTTALELVFAGLFLCRRTPWVTSRSPLVWIVSGGGAFGMLAARPHYAPVLGLGPLYLALQVAGAAFAVVSLLSLGRSFGVVAANRGVRTAGAYRLVRHPAYAGYALADLGYVLENPKLLNIVLALVVLAFQVGRIRAEEACLETDAAYRRYRERVRFRLVPGLW
jgi:protein-S-isoprenylcysteine O-methyltransferase Ste14